MINWKNISLAVDFYKNRGYSYIEVPWIVSKEAINVTLPKDHYSLYTKYGDLVGSAEQSFIQLLMYKMIFAGKYVAVSSCFRDDDLDEFHSR
jgi:seryl-tRNA synthetase